MTRFLDLVPTPAVREKEKISMALVGTSGSGKTAGALILAKGIIRGMFPDLDDTSPEFWRKIWIADTEHNRSKAYANTTIPLTNTYVGSFMHIDFKAPYSPERVTALYDMAIESGCEVLIIDSATSTWAGTGGIQDVQQNLGGTFQDWRKIKPEEERVYDILFRSKHIHVISTVRAKASYDITSGETGKLQINKGGLN
ncbi:MAG: AAA family ATPase, partial [Niameybacter sp.]